MRQFLYQFCVLLFQPAARPKIFWDAETHRAKVLVKLWKILFVLMHTWISEAFRYLKSNVTDHKLSSAEHRTCPSSFSGQSHIQDCFPLTGCVPIVLFYNHAHNAFGMHKHAHFLILYKSLSINKSVTKKSWLPIYATARVKATARKPVSFLAS